MAPYEAWAKMNGRDITVLRYGEDPIVGLALRIGKRITKRMTQLEAFATRSDRIDENPPVPDAAKCRRLFHS